MNKYSLWALFCAGSTRVAEMPRYPQSLSRTEHDSFSHIEPVPNISAVLAPKKDGSPVLAWHRTHCYISVGLLLVIPFCRTPNLSATAARAQCSDIFVNGKLKTTANYTGQFERVNTREIK